MEHEFIFVSISWLDLYLHDNIKILLYINLIKKLFVIQGGMRNQKRKSNRGSVFKFPIPFSYVFRMIIKPEFIKCWKTRALGYDNLESNKKLDELSASLYSGLTVIDIELFFCVLFFTLYARPLDEEVFNVHYPI